MLLSIGLMVKNESKHLEHCLRSLVPVLQALDSELIVVDTGSTDDSVEIAKKFTDRVYCHEWNNDFGAMRNTVLSYARGEWFCFVDGDEVLEDPKGIVEFFVSGKYTKYNSAFIEIKNLYLTSSVDQYSSFYALRFFRKDQDFCFVGTVHEQPRFKGPSAKIDGYLVHHGYVADDKELMDYKFRRNVQLLEEALIREPNNIYHLFQLSQSYAMHRQFKKALAPIEKAYRLAKRNGLHRHLYVANHLANVYFANNMFAECEAVCNEGLRIKDQLIDLHYFRAMSQAELGKLRQSIASFDRYLSLMNAYDKGKTPVDLSLIHITIGKREFAYLTLCTVHRKLGNYQEALDYGSRVKTPGLVKQAVVQLSQIHFHLGDVMAVKELYLKWQHQEDIARCIEMSIEGHRIDLDTDQKLELSSLFEDVATDYGILNIARMRCSDRGHLQPAIWERIKGVDLNRCDAYYGDFILLFMQYEKSLVELLSGVRTDKITGFFMYLFKSHTGFLELLMAYMDSDEPWRGQGDDGQVSRIQTAALYAALQQPDVHEADYQRLFELYLNVGTQYVASCYHPRVLDMTSSSWVRIDADAFLIEMRKAMKMDIRNPEYVRCLRKALSLDPSMSKGIEWLLKTVKEVSGPSVDEEFDSLKKKVLDAIKAAINDGKLALAVSLIKEYEGIVGDDAPLCSAKGIVYMIDGHLDEAEEAFLAGLTLQPDNEDLLFNLGYLYEIRGNVTEAMRFYNEARRCAQDDGALREINEALDRLRSSQEQSISSASDVSVESALDNHIAVLQAAIQGRSR